MEPRPESAGDKTEAYFVSTGHRGESRCLCDHTEKGTWTAVFRGRCGIWEVFLKRGSKGIWRVEVTKGDRGEERGAGGREEDTETESEDAKAKSSALLAFTEQLL